MTDIVIGDITERICAVGREVPGIKIAIDPAPPVISSGDLPALWVFTDPAKYDDEEYGPEAILTTRMFRIQIAVLTIQEGDPLTRESRCRPLLDGVVRKFQSLSTLRNLPFVNSHRVTSDSGIVILPEYGSKFIGFEVRLEVEYLYQRVYESGE